MPISTSNVSFNAINTELGRSGSAQLSINDTDVRNELLYNVPAAPYDLNSVKNKDYTRKLQIGFCGYTYFAGGEFDPSGQTGWYGYMTTVYGDPNGPFGATTPAGYMSRRSNPGVWNGLIINLFMFFDEYPGPSYGIKKLLIEWDTVQLPGTWTFTDITAGVSASQTVSFAPTSLVFDTIPTAMFDWRLNEGSIRQWSLTRT